MLVARCPLLVAPPWGLQPGPVPLCRGCDVGRALQPPAGVFTLFLLLLFLQRGPPRSRLFPWGVFSILSSSLTARGLGEGPRMPNVAKTMPSYFLSRREGGLGIRGAKVDPRIDPGVRSEQDFEAEPAVATRRRREGQEGRRRAPDSMRFEPPEVRAVCPSPSGPALSCALPARARESGGARVSRGGGGSPKELKVGLTRVQ